MIHLEKTDYHDLQDLMSQRYEPKRTDLSASESHIDLFGEKEFEPGDIAELFHENTKIDAKFTERSDLTGARLITPGMLYALDRVSPDYGGHELIALPTDVSINGDIGDVLQSRRSRRSFADRSLSLEELSAVLRYGCGVSATKSGQYPDGETEKSYRTYPSPGGLYPTETYLCVVDTAGLDPGVYYYTAAEHGLRLLRSMPRDEYISTLEECLLLTDQTDIETLGVAFVLTGAFWRAKSKYGPRGYRYILQESGHLAENVLLSAEAAGLGAVPLAAYDDMNMNDLLAIDGVNEAALYTIALGTLNDN